MCQGFRTSKSFARARLCLTRSLTLSVAAATTTCTRAGVQSRRQLQEAATAVQHWLVRQIVAFILCAHGLSCDKALRSLHVQPVARTAANTGKVKSHGGILYLARCSCRLRPTPDNAPVAKHTRTCYCWRYERCSRVYCCGDHDCQ